MICSLSKGLNIVSDFWFQCQGNEKTQKEQLEMDILIPFKVKAL